MTVQEIQEIGFEKAVFGGYDMKSVDTFLERGRRRIRLHAKGKRCTQSENESARR